MEDHFLALQEHEIQDEYWGEEWKAAEYLTKKSPVQPKQQKSKLGRKRKRRDIFHFWDRRSGSPFGTSAYKVDEELYVEIVTQSSEQLPESSKCYLKVKVLKLLGMPWRSGCVMRVKCLESPEPEHVGMTFVLKIIDYCFLETFRVYGDPTIHAMKRYINMVCCGEVDKFLATVDEKFYTDDWRGDGGADRSLFSEWQQAALVHKSCQVVAEQEISSYDRLLELQGTCIPKLLYRVRTCPWHRIEAPSEHYFQLEGFVMEELDGISLGEVGKKMPHYFYREIYREAINTVNLLEYYGFEHKSLAPRNLMLRNERQLNGLPSVMLIDFHKHLMWCKDDGYFKYRQVWDGSMENRMKDVSGHYSWWAPDGAQREEEWQDILATGRFAEKDLIVHDRLRYSGPREKHVRKVGKSRALVDARLTWRVVMDDLWAVDEGKDKFEGLDERAARSRIAHKIMKEEISNVVFEWEWENWHLRALPKIADALECKVEGIVNRFEEAFEQYCERPNGPGPRIYGLADTCFPTPKQVDEVDGSYEETTAFTADRKYSAISTDSSRTASPSYSPFSLQPTAASSMTDLTSLSESDVTSVEEPDGETKGDFKIFVPKRNSLPPIDVESYELGWM